mmetsp:Transcript_42141/g.96603  ORF Transcript_42141/g.96603 Transcript_42141/m.96603 type:complete len:88 (-) Transcript_42141:396-659(-)
MTTWVIGNFFTQWHTDSRPLSPRLVDSLCILMSANQVLVLRQPKVFCDNLSMKWIRYSLTTVCCSCQRSYSHRSFQQFRSIMHVENP